MQQIGTLKIKTFVTLAKDEHGRESGKWLTMLTKHVLTHDEAKELFESVRRANSESACLHATFTITEHFH